jgi:hypothetical protein
MMNPREILTDKRDEILRIAAKHGAYNVRIFGSSARGEAGGEGQNNAIQAHGTF